MRCLKPMLIAEILRLKEELQLNYRDIADAAGCSKSTVGEILFRCKEHGLTYSDALSLSPEQINAMIYPDAFGRKQVKAEPDWEAIHKRLATNRRLNLQYIWEEEYRPA